MTNHLSVDEAMDYIFESFGYPPIDREAGEFTVQEYADKHHMKYNTACNELEQAVRAGRAKKYKRSVDGKNRNVYKVIVNN